MSVQQDNVDNKTLAVLLQLEADARNAENILSLQYLIVQLLQTFQLYGLALISI